jgi:hypothetical protein
MANQDNAKNNIVASRRELNNLTIYAEARQAWNEEVAKARLDNTSRITYQEAAENAVARWDKILGGCK